MIQRTETELHFEMSFLNPVNPFAGYYELILNNVRVRNKNFFLNLVKLNLRLGSTEPGAVLWVTQTSAAKAEAINHKRKNISDHISEFEAGLPDEGTQKFKEFHDFFVSRILGSQVHLPLDYLHFGDDNSHDNLSVFLKTNPFFASAMFSFVNEDGFREFEIKSSQLPNNWFCRVVGTLDTSYTRVDAKFNANMELIYIRTYVAYNEVFQWFRGSSRKKKANEDEQIDTACAQLLFLLGFYSQAIHSLMHVLHYILDSAIVGATSHCPDMTAWVDPYLHNVAAKYFEVKKLLLSVNGKLTGSLYKSNRDHLLNILREILKVWLHCNTAEEFVKNFLLKDVLTDTFTIEDLNSLKVLEQFIAHSNLATGYADDLCRAFEAAQPGSVPTCDAAIKSFMDDTSTVSGELSTVSTLNTWIQLFSVTGIFHGATMSFSRLMLTQPLVNLYSGEPYYDEKDVFGLRLVSGTLVGVIMDHHVFSDKIHYNWFGYRHKFHELVAEVLKCFSAGTSNLKHNYLRTLKKDIVNFKRFGWILSDYCPDGVDGKQLTLTTYI